MLPEENRLSASKEIEKVRERGRSFATPILGLRFLRTNGTAGRFAVVAGLQVHKSAVKRNLAKRRIREVLRKHLRGTVPGFDAVITARSPIVGKSYAEIEQTLVWALRKTGLMVGY